MTKLYLNLKNRPGEGIEVDAGKFFLSYRAAIEEREQGYRLKIADSAVCMECDKAILQWGGGSVGIAYLKCHCSSWECPASPFSGFAYVQHGFKRVRRWTAEERYKEALQAWGITPPEDRKPTP